MARRLFRRRRFRRLFPAGAVACFLVGLVLAAGLVGSTSVFRLLSATVFIGLAGSVGLFVILKLQDRPRR